MGALAQLSQSRVDVEPGRTCHHRHHRSQHRDRRRSLHLRSSGGGRAVGDLQPRFAVVVSRGVGHRRTSSWPRRASRPCPPAPRRWVCGSPRRRTRPGSVVEEATVNVGRLQRHHPRAGAAGDERPRARAEPSWRWTTVRTAATGPSWRDRPADGAAVPLPSSCGRRRPGQCPVRQGSHTATQRFWKGPEQTRAFRLALRDETDRPDGEGVVGGPAPASGRGSGLVASGGRAPRWVPPVRAGPLDRVDRVGPVDRPAPAARVARVAPAARLPLVARPAGAAGGSSGAPRPGGGVQPGPPGPPGPAGPRGSLAGGIAPPPGPGPAPGSPQSADTPPGAYGRWARPPAAGY